MKKIFSAFLLVATISPLTALASDDLPWAQPAPYKGDIEKLDAEKQADQAFLEWKETQIVKHAKSSDESSQAVFHFTNVGWEPVTITKVRASCGCTTAELDKTTYEPGEEGKITATFEFGRREGTQRKKIYVYTDKGPQDATILEFVTHIPTLMSVSPRLLRWGIGDEPEAKEVEIDILKSPGARLVSVEGAEDFEIEQIDKGDNNYVLRIKPKSTEGRLRAAIAIKAEIGEEKSQIMQIYLSVSG